MTCPRCQAENDPGARFCEDCGARLEAACPSCGTPYREMDLPYRLEQAEAEIEGLE